jgi:hypothetical protein
VPDSNLVSELNRGSLYAQQRCSATPQQQMQSASSAGLAGDINSRDGQCHAPSNGADPQALALVVMRVSIDGLSSECPLGP